MNQSLKTQFERELHGNILPFWREYAIDPRHGGFVGSLTNDLHLDNAVPRSAVLCARILWTFSAAYRLYQNPDDLRMANRAHDYLLEAFWDKDHAGVFWRIDAARRPVMDLKHCYAQSFAMYGLSEHHRATGDGDSARLAQQLFDLLEVHAFDGAHGGYIEGHTRDWSTLADLRLSAREPAGSKSMNTLLHIMEGYTNLLRIWPDARLKLQLRNLIDDFFDHVIDPDEHRFRLFFNEAWQPAAGAAHIVSFGHDIEGSWLLQEAAEVLGDEGLVARTKDNAVKMAGSVLAHGIASDGSVLYENEASSPSIRSTPLTAQIKTALKRAVGRPAPPAWNRKHWWAQAEAVVGFTNAFQVSGEARFRDAASRCWQVIQAQFIDRQHGDWFKVLDAGGTPITGQRKIGPWECPYHHARMCMEMAARLA